MNRITLGIDISKSTFDVAFKTINQRWQRATFPNTRNGFENLLGWIQQDESITIYGVMEATGRYGEDLANFLYLKGHKVSIVNPAQIKHYSRSLLKRSKTDKIDSQLIAEFAEKHQLAFWKPLSPLLQSFKDQVRCLNIFKRDATQISNRLEQAKDEIVRKMHQERLNHIQKQITSLETGIMQTIKNDPSLTKLVNLLVSIPGIGKVTSWSLLAELPNLETFKHAKQLAAYAGLNPSIRVSGTSIKSKGNISRVGSQLLRKILFFPAMTLMRTQNALRPFIDRLRSRGKKGKIIVGAVMHKLLHIIFGVLKKQVAFQK